MSYFDEKVAIENFFDANWTATDKTYENGSTLHSQEWVRLTIMNGDAYRATLGDNPAYRYIGMVSVSIFTAKDIGSGRALSLADMVHDLFLERTLGSIQFRVPQVRKIPDSGEWYQVDVSIAFYRGS